MRVEQNPQLYEREEWQEIDHSVTLEMVLLAAACCCFIGLVIAGYYSLHWNLICFTWFFGFE
jgi:hypothetical protein